MSGLFSSKLWKKHFDICVPSMLEPFNTALDAQTGKHMFVTKSGVKVINIDLINAARQFAQY